MPSPTVKNVSGVAARIRGINAKAGCANKIGSRTVAVNAIDLTLEKITRALLRQSYSEGVGSDYKNVWDKETHVECLLLTYVFCQSPGFS
jgi:hypothetical protein